ncbi:NADH-quinone oxidoreductase subunit 8 [Anatilimnocola aggregata]|uniref:NADH-quinone oxidoreductase subunit H n=1 Tax=Anatilimnocola aggregata TaxID=2528021 RepID=A0A517YA57_9BACT|nr:NADH-quinone oxidoreductase subunit NuoH [Anatilimnocola aggregata]QDU27108.1 NADH-quinone oxidoreductase subunit 8 [Anatilimnocola aggregata]
MSLEFFIEPLIKIAIILGGLMTAAAYFVLLERRMAAWVQDRIGPNRVGIPGTKVRLFGLGQPLADGIKFILKENYTPAHVNHALYAIAPVVILAAALTTFVVIPMGSMIPSFKIGPVESKQPIEMIAAPGIDVSILLIFALSSIAVYGVILGGWSSNNKYSFLGGLRSSAQLIAYELPLSLGILGVVLAAGSLDLDAITRAQAFQGWYAFLQPLGFVVFLIAAFAEASRLPFDLPEAEQELIGGYHTEYAGMKLLLFLVAEFLHMIAASFLIVLLFLGGWHLPYITGDPNAETISWLTAAIRIGVFQAKIFAVIVFFMLVRWSWPRFRFDQLMALAWKIMLPLGILNLVAVAVVEELRHWYAPDGSLNWTLLTIALGWVVLVVGWLGVAISNPLVTDNRPRRDLSSVEVDSQI